MKLLKEIQRIQDLAWDGDLAEAINEADRLIDLYPKDDRCWSLRSFLNARRRSIKDSLEDAKMALKCNPKEPSHILAICRLRLRLEDYEGCNEHGKVALSKESPYVKLTGTNKEEVVFYTARALYGLNRFHEAVAYLQLIEDPGFEVLNVGDVLMTKKGLMRACKAEIKSQ